MKKYIPLLFIFFALPVQSMQITTFAENNNGDVNPDLIFGAIDNNDIQKIKELVKLNPTYGKVQDIDGYTLLERAIAARRAAVVNILLPYSDVNYQNLFGYSAAHYAVKHNAGNILQRLMAFGADITLMNDSLGTPLHIASSYGFSKIIKTILRNNKQAINAVDCNGNTPLLCAFLRRYEPDDNDLSAIMVLLRNGALIDVVNNDNRTPISLSSNGSFPSYCKNYDTFIRTSAWLERKFQERLRARDVLFERFLRKGLIKNFSLPPTVVEHIKNYVGEYTGYGVCQDCQNKSHKKKSQEEDANPRPPTRRKLF